MSSDHHNNQRFITNGEEQELTIRDIRETHPPPPPRRNPSLSSSQSSEVSSAAGFTTMSREFNALVLAGTAIAEPETTETSTALERVREDTPQVETNPLAIVPDGPAVGARASEVMLHRVKGEEVETKIMAWQTAKIAKINNRFKREDAVIHGWEGAKVEKATSDMKKVERKLEEKRAKSMEKMQNEVAKAHRKAEERRACEEGRRGSKVAKVLEVANLMRAVGRPPAKLSFFS